MSNFILQEDELFMVRYTWDDLQKRSKNGYKDFVNRLFANLIIANPPLKSLFNREEIARQHASHMGEIISFTLSYLDEPETLNECTSQYLRENPDVHKLGIHYIEPLGVSLIQTLHQFLPKEKLTPQLEGLWVKLYLQMANNLLKFTNDSSDVQSLISIEQASEHETEAEVKPLVPAKTPTSKNYNKPLPPTFEPESPTEELAPTKIKFQLTSNEKYKGFRRNDGVQEIEAEIPPRASARAFNASQSLTPVSSASPSPTFQAVESFTPPCAPFDPRASRKLSRGPLTGKREESPHSSSDYEREKDSDDDIPTMNPQRFRNNTFKVVGRGNNSALNREASEEGKFEKQSVSEYPSVREKGKLYFKKPISNTYDSDSDSDEEQKVHSTQPFDPRSFRRSSLNKNIAQLPEDDAEPLNSSTAPLFSARSSESTKFSSTSMSIPESEEEAALMEELMKMSERKQLVQQAYQRQVSNQTESQSYGYGLTPIREFESDDTSSKYDSEDESMSEANVAYEISNSHDEVSSGISSLSLQNSDSMSSANSSPTFSPMQHGKSVMNGQQQYTHQPRSASQSSEISYMKPLDIPEPRTTYAKSQAKYRASPGFMKSSFVLKQMQQNSAANSTINKKPTVNSLKQDSSSVAVIAPTAPVATNRQTMSQNSSQTSEEVKVNHPRVTTPEILSEEDEDDECLDLINSFVPVAARKKEQDPVTATRSVQNYTQKRASIQSQNQHKLHSRRSSNATSADSMVLECDRKVSLRSKLGLSRIGSKSSNKLNSMTSSTKTFPSSDMISVKSFESEQSTFSDFSFVNNSMTTPSLSSSRRESRDERRIKMPGSYKKKYNKVKSSKFNLFRPAVEA